MMKGIVASTVSRTKLQKLLPKLDKNWLNWSCNIISSSEKLIIYQEMLSYNPYRLKLIVLQMGFSNYLTHVN